MLSRQANSPKKSPAYGRPLRFPVSILFYFLAQKLEPEPLFLCGGELGLDLCERLTRGGKRLAVACIEI